MIDDTIIIKMRRDIIKKCKDKIIDSQNKPKNKDINHEEGNFTSKLKKNRGL